ncbi:MAG: hypothetical protein ACE5G2_07225 [Candidatus Krumholzibacteriia bacterium]
MRRSLLLLCLFLGASPAPAAELHPPTPHLRTYYQEERARGAQRSEVLAEALRITARHAPPPRRLQLLEQASLADPNLAEPHLERALLLLQTGDFPGACVALGDAYRAVCADATQRARWLRHLQRGAHALLLATLGTLVVLLALRVLPFVRHVAGARRQSAGAMILLATSVALGASLLSPPIGVLVGLLIVTPFLQRRERQTLALLCVALGVFEMLLPRLRPYAVLLHPASQTARIACANEGRWDPRLARQIKQGLPPGRERDLVLGLQARRNGDLETAGAHFVASLRADSTWGAAYLNLANLFFQVGDYERAAAGYRAAQTFAATSPLPHANLAQTYIRLLHYEDSDLELRAASSLDIDRITGRREAWRVDSVPVLDMPLPAAALLELAGEEAGAQPAHVDHLMQTWRGEAWRLLPLRASPWILLVIAALLASRLRRRSLAFECEECERVCCTHCAAAREDSLLLVCPLCDVPPPRHSRRSPSGASGARGRPNPKPPYTADRGGGWLAPLFPGAADLVCGAPRAAAFAALVAWGAVLAVIAVVRAAEQPALPWYATVDVDALRLAAVVFGLAYLPGLLKLRRARRRPGRGAPLMVGA